MIRPVTGERINDMINVFRNPVFLLLPQKATPIEMIIQIMATKINVGMIKKISFLKDSS